MGKSRLFTGVLFKKSLVMPRVIETNTSYETNIVARMRARVTKRQNACRASKCAKARSCHLVETVIVSDLLTNCVCQISSLWRVRLLVIPVLMIE